jgi:hypothetical protein
METLKTFLTQFGKVEICELVDGEVMIRITKGWDNSIDSFKNMQAIQDKIEQTVGHEMPYIRETKSDKDLFQCIFYKDRLNIETTTPKTNTFKKK